MYYLFNSYVSCLVKSKQERTIRCGSCDKRKGDLIECKGACRVLYHSLCLQIDLMNVVDWNSKKEHKCLICRNGGMSNDVDDIGISYSHFERL